MKIQTFQKLQSTVIDFIVLPISLGTTLFIFFWQNLWKEYFLLASLVFTISLACLMYSIVINLLNKPLSFLIKTYKDNKKYKSVKKINISVSQQSVKTSQTIVTQPSDSNQQGTKLAKPQEVIKTPLNNEQQDQSALQLQIPTLLFTKSKQSKSQAHIFKSSPNSKSNILPFDELFSNPITQQRSRQPNFLQRQYQTQEQRYQIQRRYKQALEIQKHLENMLQLQQKQNRIRQEYQQRYENYKQSLKNFSLDKQMIDYLVYETKQIVKEKIQQNIKRQIQNLQKIQNLVKSNFIVNFKPFRARSRNIRHDKYNYHANTQFNRDYYSLSGNNNGQYNFSQKDGNSLQQRHRQKNSFQRQFHQINDQITFDGMLKQCINLLNSSYFDFEYNGKLGKQEEIKNQLKMLLLKRIQLDQYLLLRKPLTAIKQVIAGQSNLNMNRQQQITSEFEQQRYLNIVKLQQLSSILNQRQNMQQNLLKQFFSTPQHLLYSKDQKPVQKINDRKNYQLLITFMTRIFNQKLNDVDNQQFIKVQLSQPNFSNQSSNVIWIKKQKSYEPHYNIIYALKQESKNVQNKDKNQINQNQIKQAENVSAPLNQQKVFCMPGYNNIWICILFVRIIISKMGLFQNKYLQAIKDKQLRKDVSRLLKLL